MSQSITVSPRRVYGRTIADPIDPTAKLFCQLCGQSTLTAEQLRIIQQLGFEVVQEMEGIKL